MLWSDGGLLRPEEMHYLQFDTIYELCSNCLDMMVEGPWESLYEVVASDLPPSMASPMCRRL